MNIKRTLIVFTIALFSLTALAPHAWAGSVQQHRVEGVILGIGALMIGKAILDAHHGDHHVDAHVAAYRHDRVRPARPHHQWEARRVWVPAKTKKVWNPGHYTRHGRWVPGHWTRIEVRPGHWTIRRVHVRHH